MQELGLNKEPVEPRKRFWQRQFQMQSTESQKYFDWIFGVIMPVVCFVFDPLVFKGGTGLLGTYKPFAYILSFVSVMALSAWLIWGEKLRWLNAWLAGLFITSATISLGIGIILLPFSLLGLIIVIGVLGFTPLLTSIVFLRNTLRAYDSAKPFLERRILLNSLVLSVVFSLAFPLALNLKIERTLNQMKNGDAQTIRAGARQLKYFAPLINSQLLKQNYRSVDAQQNGERRAALADAYEELTGKSIESSANNFND